jgi:hypothetical protein
MKLLFQTQVFMQISTFINFKIQQLLSYRRTDGRYLIWYCAYANSYKHPNEQKRLAPYDAIPDSGPRHLGGIILPCAAKVLLWPKSDEGNATPPSSILSISA